MEFLAESDKQVVARETSLPLEEAPTHLVEALIVGRRDAFIAGMTSVEDDPEFRTCLYEGALAASFFRNEEDAYTAVALSLVWNVDEKHTLFRKFQDTDRSFKMLSRDNYISHFVRMEKKVEEALKIPMDELLASDDIVLNTVGLTLLARQQIIDQRENQAK
jgi:hypothetical protein